MGKGLRSPSGRAIKRAESSLAIQLGRLFTAAVTAAPSPLCLGSHSPKPHDVDGFDET